VLPNFVPCYAAAWNAVAYHAEQHNIGVHEISCKERIDEGKLISIVPADQVLSLHESSAAGLAYFWLPASALEALLSAMTPTAAAANDEMVVCAGVTGLCAAAGWTDVLVAVPASTQADQAASKLGNVTPAECWVHDADTAEVGCQHFQQVLLLWNGYLQMVPNVPKVQVVG